MADRPAWLDTVAKYHVERGMRRDDFVMLNLLCASGLTVDEYGEAWDDAVRAFHAAPSIRETGE